MSRLGRRRVVDRAKAIKYRTVAKDLHQTVHDLADIAEEGSGNAIGILVVHCAIAWADAVCIAWAGYKSTEGDHEKAADALRHALGSRVDADALKTLIGIIQQKDTVSYQGVAYDLTHA